MSSATDSLFEIKNYSIKYYNVLNQVLFYVFFTPKIVIANSSNILVIIETLLEMYLNACNVPLHISLF